jgi:hypothetical protein
LCKLRRSLQTDILNSFDAWYLAFDDYYNENVKDLEGGTPLLSLSEDVYRARLTQFMFSAAGAKYRLLFQYDEEPKCTEPFPNMMVGISS